MSKINTSYLNSGSSLRPNLSTPSARQGLTIRSGFEAGASSARAAGIKAPRIKAQFVDPLIDKVGPAIQGKEIADFSDNILRTAKRIKDKEDTLRATEILEDTRKTLRGMQEEFFTTQGEETVSASKSYKDNVERLVASRINNQPKSIQAKLLNPLLNLQERDINKAFKYTIAQKKIWEKDVEALQIEGIKTDLSGMLANPQESEQFVTRALFSMYPDKVDGTLDKSNALKRQKAYEDISKARISMLINSPGGAGAAMQQYDLIKDNLPIDVKAGIVSQVTNAFIAQENRHLAEENRRERAIKKRREALLDRAWADGLDGSPITDEEISKRVRAGLMKPSEAIAYKKAFEQGGPAEDDPIEFNDLSEKMLDPSDADINEVLESRKLKNTTKLSLIKTARGHEVSRQKQELKIAFDKIKAWTSPPKYMKGFETRASKLKEAQAKGMLLKRIENGEPLDEALKFLEPLYNRDYVPNDIPPILGDIIPTSKDQVPAVAAAIKKAKSSGLLTKDQEIEELQKLKAYKELLK